MIENIVYFQMDDVREEVYMENIEKYRKADYEIDSIYIKRWSPRAFSDKKVTEEVLFSLFEAARWAPSAANIQPWHFIFARSEKDRKKFLSFINDGNVIWCDKAPVLVAVISKETTESGRMNSSHAFDTGTAWGYLSLEAARKGLIAHAMGGFDHQKAKEVLQLPDNYTVHAMIAIGYQGSKDMLAEQLKEREKPSTRKKINEFISEGSFKE